MSLPGSILIPDDVLEIARTLEGAGFEAWCVGGAIRDTLLGEPNSDFDIATSATPDQVKGLFKHTVPVGEEFGTIAVRTQRRYHEVTTFRLDVSTDGRRAVVAFGVSLEEDLARRDFTINSLAYHPLKHEWRDPFNGRNDLDLRVLRAVGDPTLRFREDYLRILRALRFAARFDFAIEPDTWAAAAGATDGLPTLSAERVRDEWFKSLRTARSVARLVKLWQDSGVAARWLPELMLQTNEQGRGLSAAMLAGLDARRGVPLARDPILLTALLCREPVVVLGRLKASRAEIARAAAIVTGPPEPAGLTPLEVRRWLAAVGDAADDLSMIWQLRYGIAPAWVPVVRGVRERGEPLNRKALAISGDDLVAAGMPPGPALGSILDQLLALVVDDPELNGREILLARAERLA
ncbi:MAG: CCA tRNA nucleotidyltransferase [Gemmatimonadota bacterium]